MKDIKKTIYPQNLIDDIVKHTDVHLDVDYNKPDVMNGIAAAIATLSDQEQKMLLLRYRYHSTLEEVGAQFDLTNERARQIIVRALRKLIVKPRRLLMTEGLEGYIEAEAKRIAKYKIKVALHQEYMRGYERGFAVASGNAENQELISLIEKPKWVGKGSDGCAYTKEAKDTLIPDIITIAGDMFIIFDAKYYNIQMDEKKELRGQPGIESVTKQYLYQLAYKDFINVHGFASVKNCFLMPTDGEQVDCRGYVTMSMLADLGLENIMVRLLPATEVYDHYLNQTFFNIELLKF